MEDESSNTSIVPGFNRRRRVGAAAFGCQVKKGWRTNPDGPFVILGPLRGGS